MKFLATIGSIALLASAADPITKSSVVVSDPNLKPKNCTPENLKKISDVFEDCVEPIDNMYAVTVTADITEKLSFTKCDKVTPENGKAPKPMAYLNIPSIEGLTTGTLKVDQATGVEPSNSCTEMELRMVKTSDYGKMCEVKDLNNAGRKVSFRNSAFVSAEIKEDLAFTSEGFTLVFTSNQANCKIDSVDAVDVDMKLLYVKGGSANSGSALLTTAAATIVGLALALFL